MQQELMRSGWEDRFSRRRDVRRPAGGMLGRKRSPVRADDICLSPTCRRLEKSALHFKIKTVFKA
jgi:hypothetical protein